MVRPAHIPVLVDEAIGALKVQPGGRYIDCTVGAGGHAAAILERSQPGGQLLGIDADPKAIAFARSGFQTYGDSVLFVNDNFSNLESICYRLDFVPVYGILFDLGLASFQIDTARRGFSFQQDAPLDMRVNPGYDLTAADIVNSYSEAELSNLLRNYGEEPFSSRIARAIVHARPLETTLELAQVVEGAVGGRRGKIHPATRTFQALRIAVNHELENLELALAQAVKLLGFEGRLAVISYHSLEDRIVKQFMRREGSDCVCPPGTPTCVCGHKAKLRPVARRIITPSEDEIRRNPRSRSARLRVAERVLGEDERYGILEKLVASVKVGANAWRQPALLKRMRRLFSGGLTV